MNRLLILVVLFIVGCGGDDDDSRGPAPTAGTSDNTGGSGAELVPIKWDCVCEAECDGAYSSEAIPDVCCSPEAVQKTIDKGVLLCAEQLEGRCVDYGACTCVCDPLGDICQIPNC